MLVTQCRASDEVFEWRDPDTGSTHLFAATQLCEWLQTNEYEKCKTPVEANAAVFYIKNRGIDLDKVKAMPIAVLTKPLCYLDMDDGTHLLIDGHHRFVALAAYKMPNSIAWVVPSVIWKFFELNDHYTDLENIPTPKQEAVL